MSKNKLQKFAENKTLKNIIQPTREEIINQTKRFKGEWNNSYFKNNNPIVLELGCGKGEYTIALAKENPDKNYIGIDIKGARFWQGAKIALAENLTNILFIRTQIELIDQIFNKEEIDQIWITFPDPQIKYKRTKHRLTNPIFLEKYNKIIKKEGIIHLKTDSEFLHGYTLGILQALNKEIIMSQHDVYGSGDDKLPQYLLKTQTFYEKMFLKEGKKITYIQFKP